MLSASMVVFTSSHGSPRLAVSGPPGGEPGPPEVAEGRAGKKRRFGGDAGPCPWSQSGREREERVDKKDVGPIMPSLVR